MKKYNSQFKDEISESQEGSKIYKALGVIIKDMAKLDMSNLTPQEKSSIKDRCEEINKNM
ncbi:MAG: hypothetical protein GY853_09900 [PVC group bacterium]|nr:hypothetical protein [PVC group bacterium]